MDKAKVMFISTAAGLQNVFVDRWINNVKTALTAPYVMAFFQKYMGGADRVGMMKRREASYARRFKTRKWWVKALMGVFDLVLVNTYAVYSWLHPKVTHRAFLESLFVDMINHDPTGAGATTASSSSRDGPRTLVQPRLGSDVHVHTLALLPRCPRKGHFKNGHARDMQKKLVCVVCRSKNNLTAYECVECAISLHPQCAHLHAGIDRDANLTALAGAAAQLQR